MESENKILLSVLTVSYNESDNIRKTIESVLSQTESNFEFVIKDGGSEDDTNVIADSYKEEFENRGIPFIHVIQADKGIYDAMNKGAEMCSGKYILFLNAGDAFYNNAVVTSLVNNNNNADICYGDARMCDNGTFVLFRADMGLITKRMPFSHQSCFVKRNIFLSEKYNLQYKICADYDLILRLHMKKYVFENINCIVCDYDMSGISSTQFVKKRKEHEQILFSYDLNNKASYMFHMAEAYFKQLISGLVPLEKMTFFKRIYKKYVKHYESI